MRAVQALAATAHLVGNRLMHIHGKALTETTYA